MFEYIIFRSEYLENIAQKNYSIIVHAAPLQVYTVLQSLGIQSDTG